MSEKETIINEELESENQEIEKENLENSEVESEEEFNVFNLSEEESKNMLSEVLQTNQEILEELKKEKIASADYKDRWYRVSAEFENYKKRNVDLRKNAYDDGKTDAIKNLLLIGDSLDRALELNMDEATRSGVELIAKQFLETMISLGVEQINPIGEEFSPENAEAIAMVEALEGEKSGIIRQVFKKGYKLNGKIIRYAQVIVVS